DADPRLPGARDEVPVPGGVAADEIPGLRRRALGCADADSRSADSERDEARGIGSDEVPGDRVRPARVEQKDAVARAAVDDEAADHRAGPAGPDRDARA